MPAATPTSSISFKACLSTYYRPEGLPEVAQLNIPSSEVSTPKLAGKVHSYPEVKSVCFYFVIYKTALMKTLPVRTYCYRPRTVAKSKSSVARRSKLVVKHAFHFIDLFITGHVCT